MGGLRHCFSNKWGPQLGNMLTPRACGISQSALHWTGWARGTLLSQIREKDQCTHILPCSCRTGTRQHRVLLSLTPTSAKPNTHLVIMRTLPLWYTNGDGCRGEKRA